MYFGYLKSRQIDKLRDEFLRLKYPEDLAIILRMPLFKLQLLRRSPEYEVFHIPKKNGIRLIESPCEPLKKIQFKMKNGLQAVYAGCCAEAAYGYVLHALRSREPRNILYNAKKHLGQKYMLNLDLSDFFHQVTSERVSTLLQEPPFEFREKLSKLFTGLTTFNGRLPMGSPTSPPLSNFAMLLVDQVLTGWCKDHQITYTRYVDDLTFSSEHEINYNTLENIGGILIKHRFVINSKKIRFFGPEDMKIVTGLELKNDKVKVPEGFIHDLLKDIERFRATTELNYLLPDARTKDWIERAEKALLGRINFVGAIEGTDSEIYHRSMARLNKSLKISEDLESRSWSDFPEYKV